MSDMSNDTNIELSEAKRIVEGVLRERLGSAGFARATVTEGRDLDGNRILKIRSVFKKGKTSLRGLDSIKAIHEVRRALLKAGDDRFPRIVHELPEDKAA